MHGSHCVRSWSITQAVISLSTGEAEMYGVIRGASMALGFQSLVKDLGSRLPIVIFSDSAAARGMIRRSGLGKVRHLHVSELWIQEALEKERFSLEAIPGKENPADILTKNVEAKLIEKHCSALGLFAKEGRASAAPMIIQDQNQM